MEHEKGESNHNMASQPRKRVHVMYGRRQFSTASKTKSGIYISLKLSKNIARPDGKEIETMYSTLFTFTKRGQKKVFHFINHFYQI